MGLYDPYRQFYPESAEVAQVDLRAESLGNRCRLDLGLVGSIGPTIDALLPLLTAKSDRTYPGVFGSVGEPRSRKTAADRSPAGASQASFSGKSVGMA
jgi:thiamine pyrophosphate-dependent acetolactate synthase large subunit-like protein